MSHWYDHDIICPNCGVIRRVTVASLAQGWPITCRRCSRDLMPLPEGIEEPPVADEWQDGVERNRRYWKRCYQKAGEYVLAHSQTAIGFGVILDKAFPVNHCWVWLPEDAWLTPVVFDGVWQRFMEWDDYAELRGAFQYHRMDREEYLEAVLTFGHYGPF